MKFSGRVSGLAWMMGAALLVTVGAPAAAAQTFTTLVNFDGNHGAEPYFENLIADANGNLFGTTAAGGARGLGLGNAGLVADTNGNLFGTAAFGGLTGNGTVFEIAKTTGGYASTPTILFNFDSANGATPYGTLFAGTNGNLFGTTFQGGAYGLGTVFEIANTSGSYSAVPNVLASFDGTNGGDTTDGLIADTNGNLFGMSPFGGASGNGTVFEITGSGFVPLVRFAGVPGTGNCAGASTSALAHTYGGLAAAAKALGYASVADLQSAIAAYCGN